MLKIILKKFIKLFLLEEYKNVSIYIYIYIYMHYILIQGIQLKSGPYFNMSNLFTKIYKILYYTNKLYLQ